MGGKFSGFLICSDFDGTLTCDGRTVPRANLEAIERFESEGGLFTVASGRFPGQIAAIPDLCINTFAVAVNGSVIADIRERPPRLLWTSEVDREVVRRLGERFERMTDVDALIIHSAEDSVTLRHGSPDNPELLLKALSRPVYKFILMREPEITPEIREYAAREFPEVEFEQSWPAGLEGRPGNAGKGNAVRTLVELLGGREVIHTVIAVGDYENDISMIRYADTGYATANAAENVKAAADRVTVSNRDGAIAAIIRDIG
ncbi:MAG: Cof-type HAD-IIB family hydrolase [Clostridiales bacterium]|nr:Cof-type HAD-IIB family hydrolase [Clostridiales bacterium]MDY4433975.1 HAD family hydrolase [Candidatus Flemingibacterium sp.]